MKVEQIKDDNISSIRSLILSGEESKDLQKHYLVVDNLVYYLFNVEDDPCMRLFVPRHLKTYVVKQYHDQNGHMRVRKLLILFIRNIIGQIYFNKLISMFQNVLFVKLGHYKK